MRKLWMTLLIVAMLAPTSFAGGFTTARQVEKEALQNAKEKRAALNSLAKDIKNFFGAVDTTVAKGRDENKAKWSNAKQTISDGKQVLTALRPKDPNRVVTLGVIGDFSVGELMEEIKDQKHESGLLVDRLEVQNKILKVVENSSEEWRRKIAKALARIPSDKEIKDLAELKAHEINLHVLKKRIEKISIPEEVETSVWPGCSK